MPLLTDPHHLHTAARACMRRASAPGADGMSWAMFRQGLRDRLAGLAGQLRDGTWRPGPPRLVEITAYTGKVFTALIPTVADRVVHRAMRRAIDPVLEAHAYCDWVSGYRPGRNRITALRQAAAPLAAGHTWITDVDVAGASKGGSVEQMVNWLAEYISDGTFLTRVRTALVGLPSPLIPGSGLWPALFHLRLSQVDRHLDGIRTVRFADNYVVFTDNGGAARQAFAGIVGALSTAGLSAHPRKSGIQPPGHRNVEDLFLIDG